METAWGKLRWKERDRSAGQCGRTVKCGNSLGGAPLEGARSKRRRKVDGRNSWAGGSGVEAPDEVNTVKGENSFGILASAAGGALLKGARSKRWTRWTDGEAWK